MARSISIPQKSLKGAHGVKAVICVGPSGSGKTTWAEWLVEKRSAVGQRWAILGRHEIRQAILFKKGVSLNEMKQELMSWNYSPKSAGEIQVSREWLKELDRLVSSGCHGIVFTDTNVSDHGARCESILKKQGFAVSDIVRKEFVCEWDELISRDKSRGLGVGEATLARQVINFAKFSALAKSKLPSSLSESSIRTQAPRGLSKRRAVG